MQRIQVYPHIPPGACVHGMGGQLSPSTWLSLHQELMFNIQNKTWVLASTTECIRLFLLDTSIIVACLVRSTLPAHFHSPCTMRISKINKTISCYQTQGIITSCSVSDGSISFLSSEHTSLSASAAAPQFVLYALFRRWLHCRSCSPTHTAVMGGFLQTQEDCVFAANSTLLILTPLV